MSFVKCMKCYFCHGNFSLVDENFPVDLYDLIVKHNLDQLIWVCKSCKNILEKSRCCALHQIDTEQKTIKEKLTELTENVRLLTEEVKNNKKSQRVTHISFDDECTLPDSSSDQASNNSSSDTCYTSPTKSSVKNSVLPSIHSVINKIKIPEEQDANSKKVVKSVIELLQFHFLQDTEFSHLWNKRLYYTGSSYSNLRIISATEYDINLVLQIPYHTLTPVILDDKHSYGKIKCKAVPNANIPDQVSKFVKSCSVNGYLQPQKILSWLQGQIDIVLKKKLDFPLNVTNIKSSGSGPARTIVIETVWDYEISVDLVPVFEFESTALKETHIYTSLMRINDDPLKHNWFMVPKACQGDSDMLISEAAVSWRLDFPNTEKIFLHNKECAKNIIKILKYLRDKKDWKGLVSYFIKTVVLLGLMKYPDKQHWHGKFVFERLLETMKQLKNHLENQHLPHFLTQKNLFYKLNKDQGQNWANHLQRVIDSIESDPDTILNHF